MTRVLLTALCFALLLTGACNGDDDHRGHGSGGNGGGGGEGSMVSCENDARADVFASNLTKASLSGNVKITLLSSDPAPPARGDNTWKIRVTDADGTPISDAPLSVEPFMPDHGHSTPVSATISGGADGTYEITPLNLFMPGVWRITIGGAVDSSPNNDVVFYFCIAG